MQVRMIVFYRRFRKSLRNVSRNYHSPKHKSDTTILCCIKSLKSAYLIYTVAETSSHAVHCNLTVLHGLIK